MYGASKTSPQRKSLQQATEALVWSRSSCLQRPGVEEADLKIRICTREELFFSPSDGKLLLSFHLGGRDRGEVALVALYEWSSPAGLWLSVLWVEKFTSKEENKWKKRIKNIWFALQGQISMRRIISSAKSGLVLAELTAGAVVSAFQLTAAGIFLKLTASTPP